MHDRSEPGAPGFTLIELLVVVSMIVLLIALLLPALGKTRDTAKQMSCASNMRQLASAIRQYVDEYGKYPQPSENSAVGDSEQAASALWFNAVDRFLGEHEAEYSTGDVDERNYLPIKQDPAWASAIPGDKRDVNRTIKMNKNFEGGGSSGEPLFWGRNAVRYPSNSVLLVDGWAYDLYPHNTTHTQLFAGTEGIVGLRHERGANVAFADHHVEYVRQDIRTLSSGEGWYLDPDPLQRLYWKFRLGRP